MLDLPPQQPPLPLGLRYYLLRGNAMIPMVPVDQLPFQLRGIPQHLSHRQMSDENWKLLEETAAVCLKIPTQVLHQSKTKQGDTKESGYRAPDHIVRMQSSDEEPETPPLHQDRSLPMRNDSKHTVTPRMAGNDVQNIVINGTIGATPSVASSPTLSYPSGIQPDHSRKEYCTYWIKTGECAYTSYGCKYKHEMPEKETLKELGFNEEPRWYKDKKRISARPATWLERRLADGGSDIDSEPSPMRVFPKPLTVKRKTPGDFPSPKSILQRSEPQETLTVEPDMSRNADGRTVLSKLAAKEHRLQSAGLLIDLDGTSVSKPTERQSTASQNKTCAPILTTAKPQCKPIHTSSDLVKPATTKAARPRERSKSPEIPIDCRSISSDESIDVVNYIRSQGTKSFTETSAKKQPGLAASKYASKILQSERKGFQNKHKGYRGRTFSLERKLLEAEQAAAVRHVAAPVGPRAKGRKLGSESLLGPDRRTLSLI